MNKKFLIISACALLAIIFLSFYFFFFRQSEETEFVGSQSAEFTAPQRWDDFLIASHSLDWIENVMRDWRGAYNSLYNCTMLEDDIGFVCDSGYSSNRTGMAVMWANYQVWKATNDPQSLTRLQNALAIYSNENLVEIIQVHDLACYYLLPIYLDPSPAITNIDRQSIANICNRTFHESTLALNTIVIPEDSFSSDVQDKVNRIISDNNADNSNDFFPVISESGESVSPELNWSAFATDRLATYMITPEFGSEFFVPLPTARAYFAGALTSYLQVENPNQEQMCPLLLASTLFCQNDPILGQSACKLADYFTPKVLDINNLDTSNTTGFADCAMALSKHRRFFVDLIKEYYYSPANSNLQRTEPWLLGYTDSFTRDVVSNAVFAGLLVQE